MSRLVPYRAKVSADVAARIEQTLATTMYLVQTTGPTSYVIQEQNCEKKHKVLIGSLQTCSCGTADICIHMLFVMLKVLRVPATSPVVWQKSLIDSEIETLLRGGYREQSRPVHKPYMKKKKEEKAAQPEDVDVDRHELVEGEVCAICQEDMEDNQPLTFCRKGCGNNFHIECMKVFGESRRQSKENIICPLCRQDWGDTGLSTLRKEMDAANRAPNVHKGTSCRKCKTIPIRCERYRCVQCKNVDLCARCFKANAHDKHAFVMKQDALDPWVPALRENQPRTAISSDLIRDLENRELSTNDYDVLLQLDQGDKYPIQDYLVKVVPGSKITADNAKMFGDPSWTCPLCAQSLRIKASLHSALCEHVFHESCLARSILSQTYVCPFPGCGQALLPGLLYLQQRHKASKAEGSSDSKQEPPSVNPPLNPSFTVLGLQHQQMGVQAVGFRKVKMAKAKRGGIRSHQDGDILPSLPAIISVGIEPPEQQHTKCPSSRERRCRDLNQLEHERATSRVSSRASTTTRAKAKLTKSTRAGNLPPLDNQQSLPSLIDNGNVTETRLNHAEKIRAELKAVERERLQKQRMLREERRQRHKDNDRNPSFSGGFLGSDHAEDNLMPEARAPRRISEKRAHEFKHSKPQLQNIRQQNHLPITLPNLFVGNRK